MLTHQSKASTNSPEEMRRRSERHELAGIEVLRATHVKLLINAGYLQIPNCTALHATEIYGALSKPNRELLQHLSNACAALPKGSSTDVN